MIGSTFSKLAVASGHEVIAFTRHDGKVPFATETLRQPNDASYRLPETRLDALVHLAGESLMGLWTSSKRQRIWSSRVDLTQKLMGHLQTWDRANRPRTVLGASGIGYYGNRGDTILSETSERGTGFLSDLCEEWEKATRLSSQWGARAVHLRTSMVLASDGGAYATLRQLFRAGLGGRLGSGRQWMSWIHVEDEAAMILWALENPEVSGPLNLCAPHPELNSSFTRKLAASLHRPALLHVPAFALRLFTRRMADEMLLCSQRAIPRAATDLGYRFAHPTLEDALAALK